MSHLDPLQREVIAAEASGDWERIREAYIALGTVRYRLAQMRKTELPGVDHVDLIAGDRQTGKTTAAVEWVKAGRDLKTPRTLVVATEQVGTNVMREGLEYDEVISWRQLMNRKGRGHPRREYGIDESAAVLSEVLGVDVGLVVVCTGSTW